MDCFLSGHQYLSHARDPKMKIFYIANDKPRMSMRIVSICLLENESSNLNPGQVYNYISTKLFDLN